MHHPRPRSPRGLNLALASLLLLTLPGCFTFQHTVGIGPTEDYAVQDSDWFALWGLTAMGNPVDSQQLAEGAIDYRVTTEFTVTDIVLSAIPSLLGFYRQTTIVER